MNKFSCINCQSKHRLITKEELVENGFSPYEKSMTGGFCTMKCFRKFYPDYDPRKIEEPKEPYSGDGFWV